MHLHLMRAQLVQALLARRRAADPADPETEPALAGDVDGCEVVDCEVVGCVSGEDSGCG